MITFIIFFIVLGILILSHEFGHFIVAKKAGVLVEEFGIGLPPRIFGIKKGETLYSVNILPFGGFVKLYGEDLPVRQAGLPAEQAGQPPESDRSFYNKKFSAKFLILCAGVAMNIVVAYFLFVGVHLLGVPVVLENTNSVVSNQHIIISDVLPNSPADQAGLTLGDVIKELRVQEVVLQPVSPTDVQDFVSKYGYSAITLLVIHEGSDIEIELTPQLLGEAEKPLLGI